MGCDAEFTEALLAQDLCKLFYATSLDKEFCADGHFLVWMVDKDGAEVIR